MKYYFIVSNVLSAAQLARSKSANIPTTISNAPGSWLLRNLGTRHGFEFTESDFLRLLEVLGGRVTKENVIDSFGDRSLVEPKLTFDRQPKPVIISEVQTSKNIEPLLNVLREVLLPKLEGDIILRSANGTYVDPYSVRAVTYSDTKKRLPPPGFIYLWGTANRTARRCQPGLYRLWSVDLLHTQPLAPGTSKRIIFDFYNTIVGEVENDVAICLFDLLADSLPIVLAEKIFRFFVEDLAEIWFGTDKSRAALAALRRSQREEFFREAIIAMGGKSLDRASNKQQQRLLRINEDIEILNKKLLLLMAQREGAMRAIEGISRDLEKKQEALKDQYDLIRSHQKVEDVIVRHGVIEVLTSMIYCRHATTLSWYEIGKMKIQIYTEPPSKSDSSSAPAIMVENLTRSTMALRDGMHHPHVFKEGSLCMGGYQKPMQEYLTNHDYASLVGLIIFFLESHNPNDAAGKHLDKWPRLTSSEVAELTAQGVLPADSKGENNG